MGKVKEKISLVLVGLAYLVFNFRYAPGRLSGSLAATGMQILTTAPYVIGLTFLLATFMQRVSGERLHWDRLFRIYCTFGIIVGFLYALNDYWTMG